MIITIDGPAGSGKSTATRKLAARLGIAYLDTGAMYRAVTLKALRTRTNLEDAQALARLARTADIRLECSPTHMRVLLDGADVSEAIREIAVDRATGHVARVPAVREVLVAKQRQIGRQLGSLVTEGRDQGSVVFPDADVKFFLDAKIEKRAERRYHEMLADGQDVRYEQVLESLKLRDGNDASRWAPLLVPGGAIRIDTTDMTITQVVDLLESHVRRLARP